MNISRRVVITGMGIVSPLALSPEGLWNALCNRESGVRAYDLPNSTSLPIRFAAPPVESSCDVDSFGNLDASQKKAIRKGFKVMSREILMAVAATQRALTDAGIAFGRIPARRVGVSFGCDHIMTTPDELFAGVQACSESVSGPAGTVRRFDFDRWARQGLPKMTPLWQLKYLPNMPASHIAIYNDFQGPNNSMTLREASIGAVLGESINTIRRGRADVMLVGTTGTRLHPYKLAQAVQQEELAPPGGDPATACRPFDPTRDGTVLGEGAGALVLESEEHADARGATILAEVVAGSYSATFDRNGVDRRRDTIVRVLENILGLCEIDVNTVGHINAHGLGGIGADSAEAQGIQAVFGDSPIPVTTAKGHLGNLGAGSGAIELIAGVQSLRNGRLFPTLNNTADDPACPVRVVRDADTPSGDSFIKLAFNPQGQASALFVRKI